MKLFNMFGVLVFSADVSTIKELLVLAVKSGANLQGANLYGANLYGADLQGANLYIASLQGANLYIASLRGANLQGATLQGANLYRANLYGASLQGANLYIASLQGADLQGANLYGASLQGANLYGANLQGANLQGANLQGANLQGANLQGANLQGANLQGANLQGANLQGANLQGAKNVSETVLGEASILPEGNLVGWKKCKNGVIVKLLIPQKARRSNSSGRKCRAEYVKVLRVFGAEYGISQFISTTVYRKGETVTCDSWNEDRWVECGGGIHFFITRIEAENYMPVKLEPRTGSEETLCISVSEND